MTTTADPAAPTPTPDEDDPARSLNRVVGIAAATLALIAVAGVAIFVGNPHPTGQACSNRLECVSIHGVAGADGLSPVGADTRGGAHVPPGTAQQPATVPDAQLDTTPYPRGFGQSFVWADGATVTISAPMEAWRPDTNPLTGDPAPFNRAVTVFKVSVKAAPGTTMNVGDVRVTATPEGSMTGNAEPTPAGRVPADLVGLNDPPATAVDGASYAVAFDGHAPYWTVALSPDRAAGHPDATFTTDGMSQSAALTEARNAAAGG